MFKYFIGLTSLIHPMKILSSLLCTVSLRFRNKKNENNLNMSPGPDLRCQEVKTGRINQMCKNSQYLDEEE
jgi:hypothetical protein